MPRISSKIFRKIA